MERAFSFEQHSENEVEPGELLRRENLAKKELEIYSEIEHETELLEAAMKSKNWAVVAQYAEEIAKKAKVGEEVQELKFDREKHMELKDPERLSPKPESLN